jgi:hypothetical protein
VGKEKKKDKPQISPITQIRIGEGFFVGVFCPVRVAVPAGVELLRLPESV